MLENSEDIAGNIGSPAVPSPVAQCASFGFRPWAAPPLPCACAGASWAFATAGAVDAAWATGFNTSAPSCPRQQLLDCTYAGWSTLDGACLGAPRGRPGVRRRAPAVGTGLRSAAA